MKEGKRHLFLQMICIGLTCLLLWTVYELAIQWNERRQIEDAMLRAVQRIEQLENENEILREENENLKMSQIK